MANNTIKKNRLTELAKILLLETSYDENNNIIYGLSAEDIMQRLEALNLKPERKTLYNDFAILITSGLDICKKKNGRTTFYYLRSLPFGFESQDIKLLIDAVNAAPFVSERKCNDLNKKFDSLFCERRKDELKRFVYSPGKIKSMHSAPYSQLDLISSAINRARKITFDYYSWGPDGKLHKQSLVNPVVPLGVIYDERCYYIATYIIEDNTYNFFKTDKVRDLTITREFYEQNEKIKEFDITKFKVFNSKVIETNDIELTITFPNDSADNVFDRFGKDVSLNQEEDHFFITVSTSLDDEFKNWVYINNGKIISN